MDEDENNLARNSSDISNDDEAEEEDVEVASEAIEEDNSDLLDTIEITVTAAAGSIMSMQPATNATAQLEAALNLSAIPSITTTTTQPTASSTANRTINSNRTTASTESANSNSNSSTSGAVAPSPNRIAAADWEWDYVNNEEATNNTAAGSGGIRNEAAAAAEDISATDIDITETDEAAGGSSSTSESGGAKPSFCFESSTVFLGTRKEVATLVNAECCRGGPTPELNSIMDKLFNPTTPIGNPDNIEWIRWLIAGGRTPQEFVKIGK